jgi:hypothetical protein
MQLTLYHACSSSTKVGETEWMFVWKLERLLLYIMKILGGRISDPMRWTSIQNG